MLRRFGVERGVGGIIIGSVLLGAMLVLARPASAHSGSNVVITVVVAPVRDILIDKHNQIIEILSNCPDDVTPLVYKNTFNSAPIAFNPAVHQQYTAIMARANTAHTGVIYQRAQPTISRQPIIAVLAHSGSYQSILSRVAAI
ncbi:hypothetical protein HJC99_01250 [Candidatus Saccharibacteria bacterium]|nr:hypothetical protein [Candidatus Saccharibacteria bacterium]